MAVGLVSFKSECRDSRRRCGWFGLWAAGLLIAGLAPVVGAQESVPLDVPPVMAAPVGPAHSSPQPGVTLQPEGATAADTPVPNLPDETSPLTLPSEVQQPEPLRTLTPTTGPAVLRALDKVSAQVKKLEASLDRPARFGTLEIVVRSCQKAPPEEPDESAAFLEIFDTREGQKRVFSGWMFASSPALSALEHPVYDVWILDCRNASSSSDESSPVKN